MAAWGRDDDRVFARVGRGLRRRRTWVGDEVDEAFVSVRVVDVTWTKS